MKIIDELGNTELHIAAFKNDVEKINELIGKGADTEVKNLMNLTPLIFSVIGNSIEAFECLIGFDITTNHDWINIDEMAKVFNSYKIAHYYKKMSALGLKNLLESDNNDKLIEYAKYASKNIIQHGINDAVIIKLIKLRENELVKKFIELDLYFGYSEFLDIAIEYNEQLVHFIINKYFSNNNEESKIYSNEILKNAIIFDKSYVVEEICKMVSFSKNDMFEIKKMAIKSNSIKILKFLFEKEKVIFHKTKDNKLKNLFHIAIKEMKTEIVQYFIDNGMDVNYIYSGKRPIFLAVQIGYLRIIEILAKAGTELYKNSNSKPKPIEYVLKYNERIWNKNLILEVLLTYMKDEEISDCLKKYKNIDSNIFLKLCNILVTLKKEANFIHHFI